MDNDDVVIGGLIDELLSAGPRRICDVCREEFISVLPKQMYCMKPQCQSVKYARQHYLRAMRAQEEKPVRLFVADNGEWIWEVPESNIHPFLVKFREWRRQMTLERWITKNA